MKRTFNTLCKRPGIDCVDRSGCTRCGWDPDVEANRKRRLRLGLTAIAGKKKTGT